MRLIVISNWLFGVACLGSRLGDKAAQDLASRYYFSQFWAEFTIEVLQTFQEEDIDYRKKMLQAEEDRIKKEKDEEWKRN